MIQFSKLRLNGFKSFVEKTELDIGQGLTGIVGPNGCGKSNLVEALRWSMGETSSKRMRGGSGSMEDVIFNGTEKRPARNFAEVTVVLDNSAHSAPGPFNEAEEIEVVRRIEREKGSDYKINSKTVRARDVQLLYADLMSGAGSPYLVSQGKVTTMIQAKPVDRRMILEEAAGITGLYARRHEAELRLRAADNNLKRLDDIVGGMEGRLQELKKQARQAARYRNLSAQIRQLEVMIGTLEWRRASERLHEIKSTFDEIESKVAERMLTVSQLTRTQNTQSADLPELRQQDAEFGARLQVQKLALQRLEDEALRIETTVQEAQQHLERTNADRSHEDESLSENSSVLERLEAEESTLRAGEENQEREIAIRETRRDELQIEVDRLEAEFTGLMQAVASDKAKREGLEQQIATDQGRMDAVKSRLATVRQTLEAKKADSGQDEAIAALRGEIETLETQTETLRTGIEALENALNDARARREDAREAVQLRSTEKSRVEAEVRTLESVLEMYSEDGFRAVLEDVQADEGFETALSRALGDTLMASTDEGAPIVWADSAVDVGTLPALPAGVMVLEPHVKAPAALKLALSQIGVVENVEQGRDLACQLRVGQSLVSRDGAYWRWDGLRIKAEAADRHAIQLKQKNQLADLQKRLPEVDLALESARAVLVEAEAVLSTTQEQLKESRSQQNQAEYTLRDRRISLNRSVEAQASRQAELSRLEEALTIAETDIRNLEDAITVSRKELESFDDATLAARQQKVDDAREKLTMARTRLQEAISDLEIIRQDNNRRRGRLHAIADERVNLSNRCARSRERLRELDERQEQLSAKIAELIERPVEIRKDSEGLLGVISGIESEKSVVADKLAALEAELSDTNKGLKEAEAALSEVRESRAHAMATISERQTHLEDVKSHIQEQFNMSPEELSAEAALDPENLPNLEELKAQREKDVRSRDMIGAVNLRADQEAEEMEKELSTIFTERDDLMQAIAELRNGIQMLNKEARDRLTKAFDDVNHHFKDMFTRLFKGGQAHLKMIDSDDPLEAGLEIFAQPPGKALQSLSLLSGGEQTLTAVALIFAMFLTNPAPICVLDEVDAPLDDANVDRFCDVLQEFAARGETRFLVITHHRLTMARMDRLYGVTMTERGVSQLVSVDMNQQLDFLEAA
ncbi:MAG: chromosome segregation protein SMC [Micavibrio aeruginosavorus]|uniref:Chromosome partition protein Smc n=1 Tax=Micavibrio aeruginosavorus TaxID=349221 RepID=A0A7T5R0Z3_9BACT|nr:MAG: chromosome segregation protein SMC [Micavibrio aeruginosavorus]